MPRAVRPGPSPPKSKRARPGKAAKASPPRVAAIFARFAAANPDPKGELEYINPFTLLVAGGLSAQATDARVNKATTPLFKEANTAQKMAGLGGEAPPERVKTNGPFPMNGQ